MSDTVAVPPIAAPVEAAPVVAPAAAAAAPEVAVEAAPAPVETSILGDALTKPAVQAPVEVAPAAPIAEGQSDKPAPPPSYEPFTLPEGATVDAERIGEFTSVLGKFESQTRADHASVQALGQQLMDRHVSEVQRVLQTVQEAGLAAQTAQKTAWRDQFISDPEIGGNRQQTTVNSAIEFVRTHGGTEEQQAEFRQLMNDTGLGNHPAMIRLLAKAGMAMSEGRPLAASQPSPSKPSKIQAMYGR